MWMFSILCRALFFCWTVSRGIEKIKKLPSYPAAPGDSEDGWSIRDLQWLKWCCAQPPVGHREPAGPSNFVPPACAPLLLLCWKMVQGHVSNIVDKQWWAYMQGSCRQGIWRGYQGIWSSCFLQGIGQLNSLANGRQHSCCKMLSAWQHVDKQMSLQDEWMLRESCGAGVLREAPSESLTTEGSGWAIAHEKRIHDFLEVAMDKDVVGRPVVLHHQEPKVLERFQTASWLARPVWSQKGSSLGGVGMCKSRNIVYNRSEFDSILYWNQRLSFISC